MRSAAIFRYLHNIGRLFCRTRHVFLGMEPVLYRCKRRARQKEEMKMSVRERILAIRIAEAISKHPEIAEELGISAGLVECRAVLKEPP